MIVITGAAGFVGSVMVGYLNKLGIDDIICVDDMIFENQYKNLIGKQFYKLYSTSNQIVENKIDTVIHLGANSNTLEKDWSLIYKQNIESTRFWYDFCQKNKAKFIFSSSAAVYGNGSGPLNHYAFSKQLSENEIKDSVVLRLFNVYGPNEYHKSRMSSTICHWYQQYTKNNSINLFENSHMFRRDFIYVEDMAKIIYFFINNFFPGVYDAGTGVAKSFEELSVQFINNFKSSSKEYIKMPDDLKSQYQTYSCADITALKNAGFDVENFQNIEQGTENYCIFLKENLYY